MSKVLEGMNTANKVFRTDRDAVWAAIVAIRCYEEESEFPIVEIGEQDLIDSILLSFDKQGNTIVGCINRPEIYSIEYYNRCIGMENGWIYDSIP